MITLIAALAKNRVIGKDNQIPWHLPADLKHFKEMTMGKPVLMGRKTFESIGKPLPGRRNVVISRQKDYKIVGVEMFCSIEEALIALQNEPEVMVIGGAEIYRQTLPRATRLVLTFVEGEFKGDTYFPEWKNKEWQEKAREYHFPDEKNAYPYSFVELFKAGTEK